MATAATSTDAVACFNFATNHAKIFLFAPSPDQVSAVASFISLGALPRSLTFFARNTFSPGLDRFFRNYRVPISALFSAISRAGTVLALRVQNISLSDPKVYESFAGTVGALEELSIIGCELCEPAMKAVAQALRENRSLVRFAANLLGSPAASLLLSSVQSRGTLRRLELLRSSLPPEDAHRLSSLLSQRGCCLQSLNVHWNNLHSAGAIILAEEGLSRNRTLVMLDVGQNQIGVEGARAICRALYRSRELRELRLYNNALGVKGAEEVRGLLESNRSITSMSLSENQFGDAGAAEIAKGLGRTRTLAVLDLNENQIAEVGATSLARAVLGNSSLLRITMRGNDLGPAGRKALVAAANAKKLQVEVTF